MKYGIFGGSFDPPHQGHLNLAETALNSLGLDKIFWVPTPDPPHKEKPQTGFSHRLAMVRVLIGKNGKFEASDLESTLTKPSYSLNLIRAFKDKYGQDHQWYLLIGADNWAIFPKWHEPDQVLKEVTLVVYPRDGISLESLPLEVQVLNFPEIPMQSTTIRNHLTKGEPLGLLKIPNSIRSYIQIHGLYPEASH